MLEKNSQRLNMKRFMEEALEAHNKYRAFHNARPLVINNQISKIAQEVADHCAKIKKLEHSHRQFWDNYNQRYRQLGENLYSSYDQNKLKNPKTGHLPVARWYNEITMHDFSQEYQEDTGHFTQIVWKNSREIGFGVAYSDEEIFIVAQYFPPGNVWTKFAQNVEPPISTYHIEPINYQRKNVKSNDPIKISKTDISIPDPMIEYHNKIEELVNMYKKKSELKEKLKKKATKINNQSENIKRPQNEPLIFHNNKLMNKNVTFQTLPAIKVLKKQNADSNKNIIDKTIHPTPIQKNVVNNVHLRKTSSQNYYANNYESSNIQKPVNHNIYFEKNNSNIKSLEIARKTNILQKPGIRNIYMNAEDAKDFYATTYNINNPVQPIKKKNSSNIADLKTPFSENHNFVNKSNGLLKTPLKNGILIKANTNAYQKPYKSQDNYLDYFYPNQTNVITKNLDLEPRNNLNQSNYDSYPDSQSLINSYMNIIQDYLNNKSRLDILRN